MQRLLETIDPHQFNLLLFAVLLLSTAALGSYVVWPPLEEYVDAGKTLDELERVATDGGVERDLDLLREEMRSLNRQLQGDGGEVPGDRLESFVMSALQDISWRHDVTLERVEPARGGDLQVIEEVVFAVEASGRYFDLVEWVGDVQGELGMTVIRRFALQPVESGVRDPRIRMRLTLDSYRQAENGNA